MLDVKQMGSVDCCQLSMYFISSSVWNYIIFLWEFDFKLFQSWTDTWEETI